MKGIACDITNKKEVTKLTDFVSRNGKFKSLLHTAGVSGSVKDLKKVFTIDLIATKIVVDSFDKLANQDSVVVLLSSRMGHIIPANENWDSSLKNLQTVGSFEIVSEFVNGSSDMICNFAKRVVQLLAQKNADKWDEKKQKLLSFRLGL